MQQFDNKAFDFFEDEIIQAAQKGGGLAMKYFDGFNESLDDSLNPSTEADFAVTTEILKNLLGSLPQFASKSGFEISFFAEELEGKEKGANRDSFLQNMLSDLGEKNQKYLIGNLSEFQEDLKNKCVILIDGIDGTSPFRAGIELFTIAIAVFVDAKPCMGAIYHPPLDTLYFGSINPESTTKVFMRKGEKEVCLKDKYKKRMGARIPNTIATHLTRSSKPKSLQTISKLESLVNDSQGIYMLNSGQLALAYVAAGKLGAFINNKTNVWDIAAGEVLMTAVFGKRHVTDFEGKEIDYQKGENVEVIAAADVNKLNFLKELFKI